jgi:hypothetical protein
MIGGAVFILAAESVLSNQLLLALAVYAPTVDAGRVLSIGATGLRSEFSADILPGILQAYMVALKDAFLFGTVTAACGFLASWLAPFRSILDGNRGFTAIIAT